MPGPASCKIVDMRLLGIVVALLLWQDPAVKETRDLPYFEGEGADPKKHKLDLFMPESDTPVPVVMWIHGGAWAGGDRRLYGMLGRRFAERGLGFAAISYRLSPGVQHPEHVKDCARAFAWLHANVAKHGGDPKRLFVCGQSAGGHLSALLTLDRKYLEELKVPADAVKGAIPMSGVYEIPAVREDARGPLQVIVRAFGSDADACKDASPLTHVKSCKVPMLVVTETNDSMRLRPTMQNFKAAFEREKIPGVTFIDADDRDHISIVTRMMRPEDDPVRDSVIEFVKKRCKDLDEREH